MHAVSLSWIAEQPFCVILLKVSVCWIPSRQKSCTAKLVVILIRSILGRFTFSVRARHLSVFTDAAQIRLKSIITARSRAICISFISPRIPKRRLMSIAPLKEGRTAKSLLLKNNVIENERRVTARRSLVLILVSHILSHDLKGHNGSG